MVESKAARTRPQTAPDHGTADHNFPNLTDDTVQRLAAKIFREIDDETSAVVDVSVIAANNDEVVDGYHYNSSRGTAPDQTRVLPPSEVAKAENKRLQRALDAYIAQQEFEAARMARFRRGKVGIVFDEQSEAEASELLRKATFLWKKTNESLPNERFQSMLRRTASRGTMRRGGIGMKSFYGRGGLSANPSTTFRRFSPLRSQESASPGVFSLRAPHPPRLGASSTQLTGLTLADSVVIDSDVATSAGTLTPQQAHLSIASPTPRQTMLCLSPATPSSLVEEEEELDEDGFPRIPPPTAGSEYDIPKLSKRELRLLERNKEEIAVIQRIIRGEIDVTSRFETQRLHALEVRARRYLQNAKTLRKQKEESMKREQSRVIKQTKVEHVEEFILRVVSWMVCVKLAKAGAFMEAVVNDDVRREEQRRVAWAASVLTRSFPIIFRKFLRRRRLIKFMAIARIILWIAKSQKRQFHKATALVRRFLYRMKGDPLLQVHTFTSKVRQATRIARTFFVVRLHQFRLLQRQWDAMETVILLTQPSVAIPEKELPTTPGLHAYNDGEEYDALTTGLRSYKSEVYHVFLARWKRFCASQGYPILPPALEQCRSIPKVRDAALREWFNQRNKKQLRVVTQLYLRYQSEKRSAKDMLEAAIRLRHSNAIEDVRTLYPTVRENTRMFDLLVDFEEEYSSSPFFEVMMANNRATINARMPAVPHARVLRKGHDLARMVRKGLEQSKLARMQQRTGSSLDESMRTI